MSSCSTDKIMSADSQEELPASCSSIVLNLGAGYTAPPPTPMPTSSLSSSATDYNPSAHHLDYGALEDVSVGLPHTQPTLAPTRADLDALSHYLMQQSLFSTPTLSLAISPTAQRKRRSLTCNYSPPSAAPAATASIDFIGATGEEEVNATTIDAIAATTVEQEFNTRRLSNEQFTDAAQTYHYPSEMPMGFCEESRRGIQRACQKMGAFYITVAVQEYVNFERLQLLHRAPQSSNMCVGSGPLAPLSELLDISPHHQQASSISSLIQEDDTLQLLDLPLFDLEDTSQTFQAATLDTNFRETMTKYAKVLFEISKDLLKLLLEDLCVETRAIIRGHYLKPMLYIYNNGKHEKSNDVKHEEDVVLSLSHHNVNHQGNKTVSLQAIVGNQLQTWSKRKYKVPNLDSLRNVDSGEFCIQVDLIQHQ